MSKVLCVVSIEDDGRCSVVLPVDADPALYEGIAALVLRSCLDYGASLKEVLESCAQETMSDGGKVPEPLVIG